MEGLAAAVSLADEGAVIHAEATDREGHPRNFLEVSAVLIGPDGAGQDPEAGEVALQQVGAGRYETVVDLSQPGTYLVRLQVRDGEQVLGQQTMGLAVPYSPEYRAGGRPGSRGPWGACGRPGTGRARQARPGAHSPPGDAGHEEPPAAARPAGGEAPAPPSSGEALERLRQAKERARRSSRPPSPPPEP